MKYLPILLALLFAAPAFAQSTWPADKVIYSDSDNVEDERDVPRDYAYASLPTCNAGAEFTTNYVNNSSANTACDGAGSAWSLCVCENSTWQPVNTGGTDTGPVPGCTGTQLQGADAACIDDLAELNTALGAAGIVTGAHTDGGLYVPLDGTDPMTGGLVIETGGLSIEDGEVPTPATVLLDFDTNGISIRPSTAAPAGIHIGYLAGVNDVAASNFALGPYAGESLTTSPSNILIGGYTGNSLVAGVGRNIYIGADVGRYNLGNSNTVSGYGAGKDVNAAYSATTMYGYQAGFNLEGGAGNLFFGYNSGYAVTSGLQNIIFSQNLNCTTCGYSVFLGADSFGDVISNDANVGIGWRSGRYQTGSHNNAIGLYAFRGTSGSSSGDQSVSIGNYSGFLSQGSRDIFLGYGAGYRQTTANDLLIIDNRQRASIAAELTDAIIVGQMAATPASQTLTFNAVTTVNGDLSADNLSNTNTGDNDEVNTKTTGDLCINDGSVVNCTVNLESELEAALDAINVIVATEIDTSVELDGIVGDDTGTGALVFATGPTLSGPIITDGLFIPVDDTLSIDGEITVDENDNQFKYRSNNADRVLSPERTKCFTLPDPVAADDNIPLWIEHPKITITSMRCYVSDGTHVIGNLKDASGNALDSMTCTASPIADDDGTIANATFIAGEEVEWDTASQIGTPSWLNFCWTYTVDAT